MIMVVSGGGLCYDEKCGLTQMKYGLPRVKTDESRKRGHRED